MVQGDWAALESLPEIEYCCNRTGVEGWERLRQRAIGMAWARESSRPFLAGRDQREPGWSVAVIADLTR
jgi:hypothetical protein